MRLHPDTTIHLMCEYYGIPFPTLSWLRNDILLTNGTNGTEIFFYGNISYLMVMDSFGKSGGNYLCNASNLVGDNNLNFTILCKF